MKTVGRIVFGLMLWSAASSAAWAQLSFVQQWGNIGSDNGLYMTPTGVAIDSVTGDVYVADSLNHRIQRLTAEGQFLMTWGHKGDGAAEFNEPYAVATDSRIRVVYVVDRGNNRIQKYVGDGAYLNAWGSLGSGDGQFDGPSGVAVDKAGNVYVADTNNDRIQKFDGAGIFLKSWGSNGSGEGEFDGPTGIHIDGSNNVYVTDSGNHRVQKFTKQGQFLMLFGVGGSAPGQFDSPSGIATDPGGNIYVVDGNDRIQKFDSSGNYLARAGNTGGGSTQLREPTGIAISDTVDVLVADSGNNRIQVLNGFLIPPGMTGSFYDPAFVGQGINLEVLQPQMAAAGGKGITPGTALVYWYSFDWRASAFFSFGVGEIVGDTITVDMLFDNDSGGPFFGPDWDPDDFQASVFANVSIKADGCDRLLFEFDTFDQEFYPKHPMNMERLTELAGLPCAVIKASETRDDLAREQSDSHDKGFLITRGLSGSFYDPEFEGQGINLEILSDQVPAKDGKGGSPGVVLLYWYSFDSTGRSFFTFGVGEYNGDTMVVDMLFDYDGTGPVFGPDWDSSEFNPVAFATVTIVWSGCNAGIMSFVVDHEFDDLFPAHLMNLERATAVAGLACP